MSEILTVFLYNKLQAAMAVPGRQYNRELIGAYRFRATG